MARPKQEITKETKIQFRIEKELKSRYVSACKKNKIIFSKRIRDFILNDLKKMQQITFTTKEDALIVEKRNDKYPTLIPQKNLLIKLVFYLNIKNAIMIKLFLLM